MDKRLSQKLSSLLADLDSKGLVTAATALVSGPQGILATATLAAADDSRFDLASLTKPLIATLALRLDEAGELPVAARIGEVWPRVDRHLGRHALEDLLRHRAGFVPWAPLYKLCGGPQEVPSLLLSGKLLGARTGLYSDLGYILWGLSAEQALGETLADLFRWRVAEPMGLAGLGPDPGAIPGVMACEIDTRREVDQARDLAIDLELLPAPRVGTVQDGNARFLGGLAGHAGLFGSAEELARLAGEWLQPGRFLTPSSVEGALSGGRRHLLGWELRRVKKGGGPWLDSAAFGHIGFTGGSVWVDPPSRGVFILLAHRSRGLGNLDPWRRRFHRLSIEALGERGHKT